jgi:hypothetical protein
MAWTNNSNNGNSNNGNGNKNYKPAEPIVLVNLGKIEAAIEKMASAPQFDFSDIEKSLQNISKSLTRIAVLMTCEHTKNTSGRACPGCLVKPLNSRE